MDHQRIARNNRYSGKPGRGPARQAGMEYDLVRVMCSSTVRAVLLGGNNVGGKLGGRCVG